MKKKIVYFIFLIICFYHFPLSAEISEIPHDIDNNGRIEIADGISALQILSGIRQGDASLNDSIYILKILAGERPRDEIPKDFIHITDGDTIYINWPDRSEPVRILGIDTPEVEHISSASYPFSQIGGDEAKAFLENLVNTSEKIEILRSESTSYNRTLAYLFFDGINYSPLVIKQGLAEETVSVFGDDGFPEEAEECRLAAENAVPVFIMSPYEYRKFMDNEIIPYMKAQGIYPELNSVKVHINTGTRSEFEQLWGIDSRLSDAVINYRLEHGPFNSIEDIISVKGFEPKLFEVTRHYLLIDY